MRIIPIVTIDYFEEMYIDHIAELYRCSVADLEEKISGNSTTSLNNRADRYIDTYLMNKAKTELTDENWLACKELYIQWKLFEEIELDEVSLDKKVSLHELLELFRIAIARDDNSLSIKAPMKFY